MTVSDGAFATGPLFISGSNVTLHIASGASLMSAFGPQSWPVIHNETATRNRSCASGHRPCYQDFIVVLDCHGCALVGGGMLFGRAIELQWYAGRDGHTHNSTMTASAPNMLTVQDSSDFLMRSVTILDAPKFNVELTAVRRAEIWWVNITSSWWKDGNGQVQQPYNTDGVSSPLA